MDTQLAAWAPSVHSASYHRRCSRSGHLETLAPRRCSLDPSADIDLLVPKRFDLICFMTHLILPHDNIMMCSRRSYSPPYAYRSAPNLAEKEYWKLGAGDIESGRAERGFLDYNQCSPDE